ncbi:MAG: YbaB/EbfC family nucleoid-associated protein [Micromonosporaceae bacterium]|nr:YbaB/EbfC family nucleoid-associated protein [Micromonosporaceae bacterium]
MLDDLSTAHARIDQWESDLADRVARANALASRLVELRATGRDRDGLVEVSVDANGVPLDLWLSEGVREWAASEIARQILTAMRAAHADLADQVADAARDTYGSDSPVAAAIATRMRERFGLGGDDAAR